MKFSNYQVIGTHGSLRQHVSRCLQSSAPLSRSTSRTQVQFDSAAAWRSEGCRISSEMGERYSPFSSRFHQLPVNLRSSGDVNW